MANHKSNYPLGASQHEYTRLKRQAKYLEPMTRRTFEDAGIRPGMRVLDLGSGAGDVGVLLAEMVGPAGSVVGCEIDPGAIDFAQDRITAAGISNVTFLRVDGSEPFPATLRDKPFDAIVGRGVLLYLPDPARTLAAAAKLLTPEGGIVAFLEPWLSLPPGAESPVRKVVFCIFESMRRSGAQPDLGPRLHKVFAAAGLPQPNMRYEAVMDAAEDSLLYQLIADSFVSALPQAIEYELIAPGEIDPATVPAMLRAVMSATGYALMMLPTVAAWCRTHPE